MKRHKASINGFTLSNVKTMQGLDGEIISATLCFKGRKIGDYFYGGDGGMYNFHASEGFSTAAVERAVATFPKIRRDYGLGMEEFGWDIGVLVDELLNRMDELKVYRKVADKGMVLMLIECMRNGVRIQIPLDPLKDDEDAKAYAIKVLKAKYPKYEVTGMRIVRSEEDLDVNDTEVEL